MPKCSELKGGVDIIDVSNLNRQFLFREEDVGKSKAETAAKFVERRVKGVKITPYAGKIQDKGEDYYMQFHLIICGLDSIEARRWINATVVDMVDPENPESLKPLVDGGTEGEQRTPPRSNAVDLIDWARIQGAGEGHLAYHLFLHRMPARHACSTLSGPIVHARHDTTSATTLHRMGSHYSLERATQGRDARHRRPRAYQLALPEGTG
jgi:hypothetical protein